MEGLEVTLAVKGHKKLGLILVHLPSALLLPSQSNRGAKCGGSPAGTVVSEALKVGQVGQVGAGDDGESLLWQEPAPYRGGMEVGCGGRGLPL